MKTTLSVLSLTLAATLLASLAANFADVTLPALLDTPTTFLAFVATLTCATLHGDYARRTATRVRRVAVSLKAEHPLAA